MNLENLNNDIEIDSQDVIENKIAKNETEKFKEAYFEEGTNKFKKGNPGGPGRKEGSKNYSTLYREALEMISKVNSGKDPDELQSELIANAFVKAKQSYRYYQDIMDRAYGKPVQQTQVSGEFKLNIVDLDSI